MGGRRKKGMEEEIKEKLPGGAHKEDTAGQQQQQTAMTGEYVRTHSTEVTSEKKGVMGEIKEKLPGGQH